MDTAPATASHAGFYGGPIVPPALAEPKPAAAAPRQAKTWNAQRWTLAGTILILLAGLTLRILPCFGVPDRLTEDEYLYIQNVRMLKAVGPGQYTALVQNYVAAQARMDAVMLPPTRCVYILSGWAWDAVFHSGPRMALRHVAAMFSCLSLLLGTWFALRMGGARTALVVAALMGAAPLQLMMAHRELVDGVFAFWALLSAWLLWENLQRPGRLGWCAAYAGAIAFMVLTKENAFFASVALCGIFCAAALFPGLNLGKAHWSAAAATAAGGLLGVAVLISMAGGVHTLIETYRLLVTKAEKMTFAYATGGGPWFRYLVDLMLANPAVLLPAIGGIFALRRENRAGIFLLLFIVFSCAVMVNVKNGMNLRYATMWEMPLCYLAAGPLLRMADGVRRSPLVAGALLLALVCGVELHQYFVLFVQYDIGEPVTASLMSALEIVRPMLK
jgi:4-amino-4-deoxy-L-arabinose transferase-like glycosyltransferase